MSSNDTRDFIKAAFFPDAPLPTDQELGLYLNPDEQFQHLQTLNYLESHIKADTAPPEGSVHAVLNQQSPKVRNALIATLKPIVDRRDQLNGDLDSNGTVGKLVGQLMTEDTTHCLQERMGTDADRVSDSSAPPTLVETLDAAFDLHSGEDHD